MNEHDDDRAFAPAFREAYSRTPLPSPAERARLDVVLSAPKPARRSLGWFAPRTFTLRPVAALAAAAALVVAGGTIGALLASRVSSPAGSLLVQAPRTGATTAATHAVQFVLVAPASRVMVVGDFNGWDANATPMRMGDQGAWTTTVRMSSGWHAYAFVVDGEWLPDPKAPLAPADDFGSGRSVVVVGRTGT